MLTAAFKIRASSSSGVSAFMSDCGGLEVAFWPWYPSSRVQTRTKPLDFSWRKNPQHAFLRKGSKAVCPMSHILRHLKEPESVCVEVAAFGRNYRPILAQVVPPFTTRVSGGDSWRCKWERLKTRVCTLSLRLQCIRGH